jgi:tetratricopeptide (TPR) repeat protein
LKPDYPEAQGNLGNALRDEGRLSDAVIAYRRAIQLKPDFERCHHNLGLALAEMGDPEGAIAAYRRALDLWPDFVEARVDLGDTLAGAGQLDEAVGAYRQALAIQPQLAGTWNDLGSILRELDQLDEAAAAFRKAAEIRPDYAEAHNNLGVALAELDCLDESERAIKCALAIRPDYAEAHLNLGNALAAIGRLEEATAAFDRALEIEPQFASAKFNLSMQILLRGEFKRGWELYEARREVFRTPAENFPQPIWSGEPIAGKRILIHSEQGFGDSIQFIRYASLIAARGGEALVRCPRPLVPLLRTAKGVQHVMSDADPIPPSDFHVPMLSQPRLFGTRSESIPAEVPYLYAAASRREFWKRRIARGGRFFRVGIVRVGSRKLSLLRKRHIPWQKLAPLLKVRGVEFHSLQIDRAVEQLPSFSEPIEILDSTEAIKDFADTAALVAELDLIISVDTAVAHLAGALGRPVWIMLPFVPDWRWGLEGIGHPAGGRRVGGPGAK